IIKDNGPDSYVGRVASVMQGSTETTFYTMALYYGVTSVKNTRHTLISALSADVTGFIISALSVAALLA
ncbi:MAG: spore maturation protein, partial [Oscillospiraceae bacterium]